MKEGEDVVEVDSLEEVVDFLEEGEGEDIMIIEVIPTVVVVVVVVVLVVEEEELE